MTHPLDSARLKIVRAQEHLDSLKTELRRYLDQEPFDVGTQRNGNLWTVVPNVRVSPPVSLALLIGDVVTNARAAIDYVAWELALRHLRDPLFSVDAEKRWIKFPITVDPGRPDFTNHINRLTNRKLPAPAIDLIKTVQPYNSGYEPLWTLHELVNTDKHRMPLLTIGVGQLRNISTMSIIDRTSGRSQTIASGRGTAICISIPQSVIDDVGDIDMLVDRQATGFVAFRDVAMPREPIDGTLQQIVATVANIIPAFDAFF